MEDTGWKDILRPIRDGLKDLLPHQPHDDESPEQRKIRRQRDALKGFAYLETFDELKDWNSKYVDPLQRSSYPLLKRENPIPEEPSSPKSKALLIHDFGGNYHDYESCQGIGLDEESYSCTHLQFVDTFVYFSHRLICIPPPTWTNLMHRNGVKVLGTFIIEPHTSDNDTMFLRRPKPATADEKNGQFVIASQLAAMARYYGFDGWLINIEKPFSTKVWFAGDMAEFLSQLRGELPPDGELIWYDALTGSNSVDYQNSLNRNNARFSQAAGSLLTNYKWQTGELARTKGVAGLYNMPLANIYFGIDVWAQNAYRGGPRRITWPEDHGGGTMTGLAVSKLAQYGFSSGIFAPAWPFEHFSGLQDAKAVQDTMWSGTSLQVDLPCDCGQTFQHRPAGYQDCPILSSAQEFPAGSSTYFRTNFRRAFATNDAQSTVGWDDKPIHSQLNAQSILPNPGPTWTRSGESVEFDLFAQVDDGLLIVAQPRDQGTSEGSSGLEGKMVLHHISLYRLSIPADELQTASFTVSLTHSVPGRTQGFYCKTDSCILYFRITRDAKEEPLGLFWASVQVFFTEHGIIEHLEDFVHLAGTKGTTTFSFPNPTVANGGSGSTNSQCPVVHELGFFAELSAASSSEEPQKLLHVREILIAPEGPSFSDINFDIRLGRRGEGELTHHRLVWSCEMVDSDDADDEASRGPMSSITGIFSHFDVLIDGQCLGNAYALEFMLSAKTVEQIKEKGCFTATVVGHQFCQDTCSRGSARLRWHDEEHDDWELV